MPDNLGWEPVTSVGDRLHAPTLSRPSSNRQHPQRSCDNARTAASRGSPQQSGLRLSATSRPTLQRDTNITRTELAVLLDHGRIASRSNGETDGDWDGRVVLAREGGGPSTDSN